MRSGVGADLASGGTAPSGVAAGSPALQAARPRLRAVILEREWCRVVMGASRPDAACKAIIDGVSEVTIRTLGGKFTLRVDRFIALGFTREAFRGRVS